MSGHYIKTTNPRIESLPGGCTFIHFRPGDGRQESGVRSLNGPDAVRLVVRTEEETTIEVFPGPAGFLLPKATEFR